MDFTLSESQQLVQKTARDLARNVVQPLAKKMEAEEAIDLAMLQQLANAGLIGVALPHDIGGSDAGSVAYALAIAELARACAATAVTLSVTNMVAEVISEFGSPEQRAMHCPRLCSGEWRAGAFALSEAEAGSDPGSIRTRAEPVSGGWLLQGNKQWVSNGAIADVFVVWARTGALAGTRGLSCFLVEKSNPGLQVSRHEDKMGLRASSTVALTLQNCMVPEEALLGEPQGGFRVAMKALDGGRIGIAAQALGVAEEAMGLGVQYAQEREQFGHPIAEFQAIQHMLADSRMEIDAARLLTLRAAWKKEKGVRITRDAAAAKLYASETAWRVCNRVLQIHGGYGYTREFDIEKLWRDIRVAQIYEGTSEIQRLVIARDLL